MLLSLMSLLPLLTFWGCGCSVAATSITGSASFVRSVPSPDVSWESEYQLSGTNEDHAYPMDEEERPYRTRQSSYDNTDGAVMAPSIERSRRLQTILPATVTQPMTSAGGSSRSFTVSFEHAQRDTVIVQHREGTCLDLLPNTLGGVVADPVAVTNPTITDGEQTTITYDVDTAFSAGQILGLVSGDVVSQNLTLAFCVRLSLVVDGFDTVDSYREVDVRVIREINGDEEATGNDVESTQVGQELGNVEILIQLCTALAGGMLNQGQSFDVCMTPVVDADASPVVVREDIALLVENFVFFIDPIGFGQLDPSFLSQFAVEDGLIQSGSSGMTCGLGASGQTNTGGDDVFGCRFTTTLRSDFFNAESNPITVTGKGELSVTFRLGRADGLGTSQTSLIQWQLRLEPTVAETCGSNCFILFCWFQWILCFVRDIFG